MRTFKLKKLPRVHGLHFTPDGARLLAVGGSQADAVEAVVWLDPGTGDEARRWDDLLAGGYAVTPDLSRLVLGGVLRTVGDAPVRWTDLRAEGDEPSWTDFPPAFEPEYTHVYGLALDPSGSRLAVSHGYQFRPTADLGYYEWEFDLSLSEINPPELEWRGTCGSVLGALAFSPDGARLAATGGRHSESPVYLFDLPGMETHRFDSPGTRTRCLAFSPDGSRLAAANARAVYLFSTDDLTDPVAELSGHTGQVNAVAFSPDGRRLLSASHDGAVRVWDADGGRLVRALDWKIGPVTALAVAPDGLTCAAAGKGGRVVVWDLDG